MPAVSGITKVEQDGSPSGNFVKSFIDGNGIVKATYSNGAEINYAKLAIVGFESSDNLIPVNNTLFEASNDTGIAIMLTGRIRILPILFSRRRWNLQRLMWRANLRA